MGSPLEALPKVSVNDIERLLPAIDLPPAKSIKILETKAEYHIIALLQFSNNPDDDLILRVAGPHIPRTKTENEVATITWVQQNSTIPVPAVVRYDSSIENPLGCEYVLQKRMKGQSLDLVWPSLIEDERVKVYEFMIDVLQQLLSHEWSHVGSLQLKDSGLVPGPVLDERFWEARDIAKFFPGETVESLNPLGPYSSYVEYSIARMEKYMHAIRVHDSLRFMREHLPLLERFIEALKEDGEKLNKTRLCLAHRDLHMGNIMYSLEDKRVTGILDWELSVVMPLQQGDLSRAFMHDLVMDGGWRERKPKMTKLMRERSMERIGRDIVDEYAFTSEDQEEMQTVVDLLRAIVEVSPRGQREKEKMGWRDEMVETMEGWME